MSAEEKHWIVLRGVSEDCHFERKREISGDRLGSIESWLAARRAVTHTTRFFDAPQLPELADLDLVIALGGPMSVNDEAELPWLKEEKRFISGAVSAGKAVLGICLGAQLIANALGTRIYPGPHKEIGWFDIESTSNSSELIKEEQDHVRRLSLQARKS